MELKTYVVYYNGNSIHFRNFELLVAANSEREAVEDIYATYLDENYFPQEDGSILDCDGHEIADSESDSIEYDGGYFYAEEYNDTEDEY